jgi:cell division protein FtsB
MSAAKKQRTEQQIKNLRRKRLIIAASIFILVIIWGIWGKYGLMQSYELNHKKEELNTRIQNEIRYADSLRKVIDRLNRDTMEIERLAREKYGMVKPGEQVIFIQQ